MNNKEAELHRILDIVVSCCATQISEDGKMSITKDDILGKSRVENVVMTRCILCRLISWNGYSVTTIAQMLNRTASAVRHLIALGDNYYKTSKAYRIAEAEAMLKCKDVE